MSSTLSIAQALATRFSSANVTPPTGYSNIVTSTEQLPAQIASTPTVLVFPPEETIDLATSTRLIAQEWTVRLYLVQRVGPPTRMTDLYKWRDALIGQLEGQTHLGLSTYVTQAVIRRVSIGVFEYGGTEYDGIEFGIEVGVSEAATVVA